METKDNNTLAIRPTIDDCTELFEFTLMQGSKYFTSANRKYFNTKIKWVGFIDTKTDNGNLFSIYSSGIYKSADYILAVEENDNFTDEKQYKIILINGKDILYFSNNLKDIEYYYDYRSVKKDFEYLMDCFKSNTKYNQSHKTYFNK